MPWFDSISQLVNNFASNGGSNKTSDGDPDVEFQKAHLYREALRSDTAQENIDNNTPKEEGASDEEDSSDSTGDMAESLMSDDDFTSMLSAFFM